MNACLDQAAHKLKHNDNEPLLLGRLLPAIHSLNAKRARKPMLPGSQTNALALCA